MPFIPHTDEDVRAMLAAVGASGIEALFDEIPASLRGARLTEVPAGASEQQITRLMHERAEQDGRWLNFIGAGAYEHHIPAAVWQIATRGEFYSAYTPYQAEASQGTLQTLYEYQSMIASLTGLDAANASLYDGASALAEAILMAVRLHKSSRRVLIPATVHPTYRKVARTIVANQQIELVELPYCADQGITLPESLRRFGAEAFAALVSPAAELLRLPGTGARADRLGAGAGCTGDRRRQSGCACSAGPARPMGEPGSGYRSRRRPAAGRAVEQRRTLLRLHVLQTGAYSADAGPHRRRHAGPRRQARLHLDAASTRTAHPALQGHLQHLHQPGPGGHRGHHSYGAAGSAGAQERCPGLSRQFARAARADPTCDRPWAALCGAGVS